mgnify:CR=1 FL=1
MTDHFKELLPPGVKNLDDFEIHFPNAMKQSDTNYDKDIQVDNVFIEADRHEDQMKLMAEHEDQFFKQEVTDDMLPDWMKDKEPMYNSKPEEWSGYDSLTGLEVKNGDFIYDPEDPPVHWELESK